MQHYLFEGNIFTQTQIQSGLANRNKTYFFDGDENSRKEIEIAINKKITKYTKKDTAIKLNNCGFRCDDILPTKSKLPVILFAGCSITYGEWMPIEDTWSYKIISKLKDNIDPDIKYYNVASGGAGIDKIVRSIYAFSNTLKPDIIIPLLSPISRAELLLEHCILTPQVLVNGFKSSDREITKSTLSSSDYKKLKHYEDIVFGNEYLDKYRYEKNLMMLDYFAKSIKCKILASKWGGWHNDSDANDEIPQNYKHLFAKTFFNVRPDWPKIHLGIESTLAYDGVHPGPESHDLFASLFYPEIKKEVEKIYKLKKT